ncbi:DUF2845 domain-containing protein [Pseudomonas sp. TTU2014-080ASC]|jgi:hypothetical protein|uniref:DUF2845 domain-containing protein n=1 Tax=Pseudomonas sp. TTU2014-080ASC TaxID=1729724 RepID=UPI0007185465|nr:DUF2845 domain-containing protein [Pseudomonas sp. TTU2014-080ASC]KRW59233.1 hypothetical protein AO726_10350 [Pseudomonas sp. TTU2014-080ASC]
MKALLLPLALCLPLAAHASSTLRCESGLVSLGDSSAKVFNQCGEPVSQDFIGFKEVGDEYGFRNEVKVEEWTYGPRNGMYYFLKFEGGRLSKISSKRGN